MTLPKGALKKEQLQFKGKKGVTKSGHDVQKVIIPLNGELVPAFYKPCSTKDGYPPLLAKYEVAFSICYQMLLGQHRAPTSKLVFDENNEIVGTVSIALNNFTSLVTSKSELSRDEDIASLQLPGTRELLEGDAASVLVASWFLKEDDLHNHNIGWIPVEKGDKRQHYLVKIDNDMTGWPLLSYIKSPRWIDKTPLGKVADAKLGKLSYGQLKHFPSRAPENTPHFWVTYEQIYTDKKNPSATDFRNLEKNSKFREQMHFSLLIALLSFQQRSFVARLNKELKDIPLGLEEFAKIDSDHRQNKENMVKKFLPKMFYNEHDGSERNFVDHFIQYFTAEHSELYSAIVGSDEFREYLDPRKQPTAATVLDDAIAFFEAENNSLPRGMQFDISLIRDEFQRIWRDCNRQTLNHGITVILELIEKIKMHDTAETKPVLKTVKINGTTVLVNRTKDAEEQSSSTKFSPVIDALSTLSDEYCKLTSEYEKLKSPSFEDNKCYIDKFRLAINTAEEFFLADSSIQELSKTTDQDFSGHFNELHQLINKVSFVDYESERKFKAELPRANQDFLPRNPIISSSSSSSLRNTFSLNSANIEILQELLGLWASAQDLDGLKRMARIALGKYQSRPSMYVASSVAAFCGFFSSTAKDAVTSTVSDRTKQIEKLLTQATKPCELLHDLFSTGGWDSTSFNTTLLKTMLPLATRYAVQESTNFTRYTNIEDINKFIETKANWENNIDIIHKGLVDKLKDIATSNESALSATA